MNAAVGKTPAPTAREQVARLLALVPYLIDRGDVRVEDAAAHFGVSAEQLRRDLRVLLFVGLPGGFPDDLIDVDLDALDGEGVIRVSNADYLGSPVRFAPTEAAALTVALRSLAESADGATRELVERTLAKLDEATSTLEDTPRIHVEPDRGVDSAVRPALEAALRDHRRLRMDYHVPSREEVTSREVDPRGIATVDGLVYLDAWCHTAGGDRAFRVDRIVSAEVLDVPVADPSARARDLTRDWFSATDGLEVTLELDAEAAWVPEYVPTHATRFLGDGRIQVDLRATDAEWLVRFVLRLAPHARVVSPSNLDGVVRERLRSTLAHYGG